MAVQQTPLTGVSRLVPTARSPPPSRSTSPRRITLLAAMLVVLLVALLLRLHRLERHPDLHRQRTTPSATSSRRRWAPDRRIRHGSASCRSSLGTLGVMAVAAVIAAPLSIGLAIFMAEVAPDWARHITQPAMEVFVGIPSVVYGWLGLDDPRAVPARELPRARLHARLQLVRRLARPRADDPADDHGDRLRRVHRDPAGPADAPRSRSGRRAGRRSATSSSRPPGRASSPRSSSGMMRAAGEALAVQMVIGNRPVMPTSLTQPMTTLTSQITLDMGNTVSGETWNEALWTMGLVLLVMSFGVRAARPPRSAGGRTAVDCRRARLAGGAAWPTAGDRRAVGDRRLRDRDPAARSSSTSCSPRSGRSARRSCSATRATTERRRHRAAPLELDLHPGPDAADHRPARDRWAASTWPSTPAENRLTNAIRLVAGARSAPSRRSSSACSGSRCSSTRRAGASPRIGGALALTVFNLPLMARLAEQAIRAVPPDERSASLALGATKWQTIRHVVLPLAIPGIVTGIILTAGRIFGEAAALLFTAGLSTPRPLRLRNFNLTDPSRRGARSTRRRRCRSTSGSSTPRASATSSARSRTPAAAVLVIMVLVFNLGARGLGRAAPAPAHRRLSRP